VFEPRPRVFEPRPSLPKKPGWLLPIMALANLVLGLTATALLLAGCASPTVTTGADAPTDAPPAGSQPHAHVVAYQSPNSPCPQNFSNYGVHVALGNTYYIQDTTVWKETNGIVELQTKEHCPQDPDTEVTPLEAAQAAASGARIVVLPSAAA